MGDVEYVAVAFVIAMVLFVCIWRYVYIKYCAPRIDRRRLIREVPQNGTYECNTNCITDQCPDYASTWSPPPAYDICVGNP